MIVSFRGKAVEAIAAGKAPKGFPADLVARAERRLRAVEHAATLNDLRSPPGNHLEALKGNRVGQHSIRINDQWRICFRWTEAGAEDVDCRLSLNAEARITEVPDAEIRPTHPSR